MAFEDLLISLTSKLDESGFKALDRLENKAIKKTDMLSNSLKRKAVLYGQLKPIFSLTLFQAAQSSSHFH